MKIRVFLLFTLTPPATVLAADPVAECREAHAADPQAHIACLEEALQQPGAGTHPPEIEASTETSSAAAVPAGQDIAAATPEPEAVSAAGEAAVVAAAETPAPTGMGAEQVRAAEQRDAQDEELVLHIVATSYNSRGLGTFRTEEGQVWRETTPSPERRRLKAEQQYTARIVRSKFGGYRMHVEGVRWMKTVERIE